MSYNISQGGKVLANVAGYYYVQPFSFVNGLLQINPSSARLAVTVALTGHNDDKYLAVTKNLAATGDIVIADAGGAAILSTTGFDTTEALPTQSRDLALTTWIFHGNPGSSVSFTPANIDKEPRPGRVYAEKRVRWYGYADADSKTRLYLSYVAPRISYGRPRTLTAIDLIGIANMRGSGSLVAWLLSQKSNQSLSTIKVSDDSRSAVDSIAGANPGANLQMAGAHGAAYLFNGVFKDLNSAHVASFSRSFTDQTADIIGDAAHEGSGIFANMTQPVSATTEGTAKNPDSYAIKGPDFEGLSFWDLQPHGTAETALLLY